MAITEKETETNLKHQNSETDSEISDLVEIKTILKEKWNVPREKTVKMLKATKSKAISTCKTYLIHFCWFIYLPPEIMLSLKRSV